ncbi:MAG: acetate kinase [Pseudomonadota bacterium]
MSILVINSGSSSIKSALYSPDLTETRAARVTGIGTDAGAVLSLGETETPLDAPDHAAALAAILAALGETEALIAVAHRVVHGGTKLTAPARLTPETIAVIEECIPLAPLHNPPIVSGIRAMQTLRPDLPQFASFDTAFHAGQAPSQTAYALPEAWRRLGLRRYGFHGLSYAGMVDAFGADLPERLLAFHLGAGCSLCAIHRGRSVATTMGYSPVSGPTMATRAGDVDAMAVLRMAEEVGIEATGEILNKQSGLLGLAGVRDMRRLLSMDTAKAKFAVEHFVATIVRGAGGLIAVMGGVDAFAFTGGIGENSDTIRDQIMAQLRWIGDRPVHVIPAQEERQIARDAYRLIDGA